MGTAPQRQPESERVHEHRPTQPVNLVIVCLDILENPPCSVLFSSIPKYDIWEDHAQFGGSRWDSIVQF
ncbi:hypothetical protein BDN70DRAFT_887623 [Pholiota conissans]|uniref:Uncharacterized protein n=1 Tax=Pholiota conissans TaxID=109636 RepID=A0A9P5YQ16_9AGAR|nr:hypothetical protein BDN70DRAFT_887623 [Pholiota conissans]